ncbi:bifunctional proline dehydrogenase/L-glutamate gamma-semialdehyde dehydrogenase PutA [Pseudooceanicola atlanticus]|uniref:Bifunctional protein PutA n=1 Tax=Pseudooceanicola atlanticus TaxID=1461694 RepID=A0A0A0EDZ1_9RHOB|nr:bifunctional proline dehydrogenase/L-glutamate gamma-semialdehyde dehydrogenase PutA [Pseudooceanicola atlanticus]KGM48639.1 pyrroline-5-carboxylate dehydrogenase [Pseudooceanicola atlanticus]
MLDDIRTQMRDATLAEEAASLERLIASADLSDADRARIADRAADLIRKVRASSDPGMMESFLAEYGLSTKEGVALMCMAEALLRVPDAETIDDLIQDKIAPHDWGAHVGDSGSMMVNASTWALMLTGRVLDDEQGDGVVGTLRGMVRRLGEPVIRTAVGRAMREMGAQFVLGRDIREAMKRARERESEGYTYSYDMLGEAARTEDDAMRYHGAYAQAIAAIAQSSNKPDIRENPGISVKLSALHPRYEVSHRDEMLPQMTSRTLQLARAAKDARIGFNIDAEEQDRLDLSLEVIEAVLSDDSLADWDGFGVVVQAYGPRAGYVIDWLNELATRLDRKIMVRLVKGAYWDTEIKRAQVMGLDGFPVFTRKANTDVSYISCAHKLLAYRDRIYPQFATHNAHTVAAILDMAGKDRSGFEFQRLHGMGEALHDTVLKAEGSRCRIYAPVGAHRDLLAYLVRRLLENGANSSFVHQIVDESVAPETIARDPFTVCDGAPNPAISHPSAIYGKGRLAAEGWDLTDPRDLARIEEGRTPFAEHRWSAGDADTGTPREITNPARPEDVVGTVFEASADAVKDAVARGVAAQPGWAATPVAERADILRRIADLYEANAPEIFALCTREAGKSLFDGVAEIREAVDFLRYYANQAPRAEKDSEARGLIACISPWNFPLAIFTGQIAAALATGNAVIAKPAEQTPLIAARAVQMMHEAGLPEDVIQLMPGDGPNVGAPLTADPRIAGVCFTGSTEVAKLIDRQLADTAPDAMLIAETGGMNAMIVDSTALPEQAVRDILASSFQSAGQRCSALRILYVQRDVEERVLDMLYGGMEALGMGDPWNLSTDVGPVIDAEARDGILSYCEEMEGKGRLLKQLEAPEGSDGLFVPPHVFRVSGIEEMEREIFGPVLHVARFDADEIDDVVAAVNAKGYGLTFGLHTRIDGRVQQVVDGIHVGNLYVNRNQIGAVVGSQPFGGEGLSGTGPKAGGPLYLTRFRKPKSEPSDPVVAEGKDVPADQITKALAQLAPGDWPMRGDRISTLRAALRGAIPDAMSATAALDMGPIDLPGPTGESNRLTLVPRGTVLCLSSDPEVLMDQVVQALGTGNAVLAVAPGAPATLEALVAAKVPLAAIDGTCPAEALTKLDIDAVVAMETAPYRAALAAREGAILPLITARIAPSLFVHERAVCIDTTAAGGNATLLAKAG